MEKKQEDLPLVLPFGMKPGIYLHPETFSELLTNISILYPSKCLTWQGVRIRPSRYIPQDKFLEVDEDGKWQMFSLRKRGTR